MLLVNVAARWKFSAGGSTTKDVARKVRSYENIFFTTSMVLSPTKVEAAERWKVSTIWM